MAYDYKSVESKWQKIWEEQGTFNAESSLDKPKFYALVEFPYPSGQGLHVGHPRSYTALDIIARKRRLQGYNVLYPIGWDAFGLPTENFAIKNKMHPKIVTSRFSHSVFLLTGAEKSTPQTLNITSGLNGYFYRCSKKGWHIKIKHWLIGVRLVNVFWQMKRLSTANAKGVQARLLGR